MLSRPGRLNACPTMFVGSGRQLAADSPLGACVSGPSGHRLIRAAMPDSGFLTSLALAAPFFVLTASAQEAQPKIDYNWQVRPILSDNCFRCHGPDANSRQAGLRLD